MMLGQQQYNRALKIGKGDAKKGYRQLGGRPSLIRPIETGAKKISFPSSGGGGYFGGGADAGQYGQQDIDAQNKLAEEAWRKTTPDLNYIGGSNKWTQNPDGTWALTAELGEMEQGIYDQSGMLTSTLGSQAQDFFGGGYEGMYQNRLD